MKKTIALILVALLVASVAYAYPGRGPGAAGEVKGNGNFPSECWRTFRFVRNVYKNATPNTSQPSLSRDSIVIWDTTTDDGVSVNVTTVSCDSRVAGVVVGFNTHVSNGHPEAEGYVSHKLLTVIFTSAILDCALFSSTTLKVK